MTSTKRHPLSQLVRHRLTAWLVLAALLVLTVAAWNISAQAVQRRAADRFHAEVEAVKARIVERMGDYQSILRSAVALYQAEGRQPTRTQWHHFVGSLQLHKHFPAIQGIGFSRMLKPQQLAAQQRAMRAEGFPSYRVYPPGRRTRYSTIVYLEPFDADNRHALGYDMYSDPIRRAAMVRARDSGRSALSGRVTLVQETKPDGQGDFLMYLPIYRPGSPTASVQQRRTALVGYAFAPFCTDDLMRDILGRSPPDLDFQLFDSATAGSPATLLFDSRGTVTAATTHTPRYTATTTLDVPGGTWSARFSSRPSFERTLANNQPWLILFGGLALDLLLFVIIRSQANEQERVEAKASAMTVELRESAERLRLVASVFEHAAEGVAITDADERIVDVNPTFCEITGYSRAEAIGQTPRALKSGRQDEEFYAAMWQALQHQGYWRGEIWNRKKSGEVYPELLTISAIPDATGAITHYVGIFTDISVLKEHQQYLERMVHYDALTQLPNRVLLIDRLQQAMAHARRGGNLLAVCYLDLDGFKPVNDRYGHGVGDQLLIKVAERFELNIRGGETVARLGGDEFALLLGSLDTVDECERALYRLLHTLDAPFDIGDDRQVKISASIGVTLYPVDDDNADVLLRHADQAMYLAKQAGRDRYHLFDPDFDRQARARHEARARIEAALAAEEFRLYFQPKVDMRRGRVIGAEALIRWQHPERGLLPPGEFLPSIEDTELDGRVGDWVLRRALQHMTQWKRQGLDITVSVNISSRQLQQTDFPGHIAQLLDEYAEVPAQQLMLEVLETAALNDIATVSDIIERCRGLGVSFALDDFGTGYSSLTYLKQLPANELKIDQSFVREILNNPEDLAIVEGIIGLSQAFQRQVVAEGVETVEHGVMLLHLGCDLAQGYGIARPMPAQQLPGWIAAYRPEPLWLEDQAGHWSRDDLPLITAELEHRRWIDDLAAKLENNTTVDVLFPPLDPHQCRFGRWYDGPGRTRYGHLAEFKALSTLHSRVHKLANELIDLRSAGRAQELRQRIPELFELRTQVLQRMNRLHDLVAAESVAFKAS